MTEEKVPVKRRANTRSVGRQGEDAACGWLEQNGYRIVGRNVYAAGCEADILAENDTHFVFVEVKCRREYPGAPDKFGRPAKAVTAKKKEHMLTMAKAYLREHPEILTHRSPRLDVIEVYFSPLDLPVPEGETDAPLTVLAIEHFPNAVRQKTDYTRYRNTY